LKENSNSSVEQVHPQRLLPVLDQFVTCEPLCRVPHDINPESPTKSVPTGGESPKVNEPPTPNAKETALEFSKPLSPCGARSSPNAGGAPSSNTALNLGPANRRPDKSPHTTPTNSQSFVLGSVGDPSHGGESSVPRSGKSAQRYSQVEEPLTKDPEFVKAGFHIGRFITTIVDTEKDRANMDDLYNDLESASTRLNVSIVYLLHCNLFWGGTYSPLSCRIWCSTLARRTNS
jgi:hypothetical protein